MPMTRLGILWSALLILALTAPSVRADDSCMASDEEKATKADIAAALKAEKSGKPAELFVAYQSIANHDCAHLFDKSGKDLQARAKANLPKLGRDLAKAAEAKGLLYSNEPVSTIVGAKQDKEGNVISEGTRRANERASAFAWLEAGGDHNEANRVMLKAAHAKSDDLGFFKTAWEVDQSRPGSRDPKTGEQKPHASPASYRQELQKIASANADRFMKAEEKDAAGLSGSSVDVGTATMHSIEKLSKAAGWMKYLPNGDQPARARAEQRGDTIMKRSDPMFTQMNAKAYYEFAGSSKAKEKMAQLEKKMDESGRAMEKSAEKMKGAITTEKSEADQKKFKKGKADLEKELGF
jgi:hypothetical protein